VWQLGCARRLSVPLQKLGRGWLARRRLTELIAQYRIESRYSVFVQKHFRGNYVRARDTVVTPAILKLRTERLCAQRTNAALKIQCVYRRRLATSLLLNLHADLISRIKASTIIQASARRKLAQWRRIRYQLFVEMDRYYRVKMALRIQCFARQFFARAALLKRLAFVLSLHVLEQECARTIQRQYRGMAGRRRGNAIRLEKTKAATNIQRVFRGFSVYDWRSIKWKLMSSQIKGRAALELEEAKSRHVLSGSPRNKINSNIEDRDIPIGNDSLLTYAFGESYVGLKCLVYWETDGIYRTCTVFGYDARLRLWKMKYDEDDSEYLDLVRESDRIMIHNGVDYVPYTLYRPPPLEAYLIQREGLEEKNDVSRFVHLSQGGGQRQQEQDGSGRANENTAEQQNSAIHADLWMSAYVARGLLDQYYDSFDIEKLQKLRDSRVVKALRVSIGSMTKTRNADLQHFTQLLSEVEKVLKDL
jgi:hypothetical protein